MGRSRRNGQVNRPSASLRRPPIAGAFLRSDVDTWRRVIEVNLMGSSLTARAFLPGLFTTRGYYMQVASLASITAAPMMSAYCASKSGVEAFAHALRAEVAHHGVDVGIAYLSWADTEMINAAALRELRARLPWPAGKVYRPQAVADSLVRGMERRARCSTPSRGCGLHR